MIREPPADDRIARRRRGTRAYALPLPSPKLRSAKPVIPDSSCVNSIGITNFVDARLADRLERLEVLQAHRLGVDAVGDS